MCFKFTCSVKISCVNACFIRAKPLGRTGTRIPSVAQTNSPTAANCPEWK